MEYSTVHCRIHTHYDTSSVREVTHNSSYVSFRNCDLQLHDRLEEAWLSLYDTLLERE